jgi:hypothetical protein
MPFRSISDALAGCQGACHILVGPGIYAESPQVNACTFIEGGVTIADGVAVRGATRPRIRGTVQANGAAIVSCGSTCPTLENQSPRARNRVESFRPTSLAE